MIYSDHKGNKLSSQELDNNFRELVKRLETLEGCDLPKIGIETIETQGDHLIFKGQGGVVLGDVKLPVIEPRFRGPWQADKDYRYQDWVHYQGQLYVCLQTHSAQNFNHPLWQPIEERDNQ